MSQKTNPSSLRISSKYKNFSSCWYSDYFYGEMIAYDLQIRSYIGAVLDQSLHSQAVIRVQNNYKRCFISLFLLDARGIRHSREKGLRLPLLSLQNLSQHFSDSKLGASTPQRESISANMLPINAISTNIEVKSFSLPQFLQKTKKNKIRMSSLIKMCPSLSSPCKWDIKDGFQNQNFSNTFFKVDFENSSLIETTKLDERQNQGITTIAPEAKAIGFHGRLENSINSLHSHLPGPCPPSKLASSRPDLFRSSLKKPFFWGNLSAFQRNARASHATIHPIRIIQDIQSAEFLAREIVHLLQKRAAFREIQSHILRQVLKSETIKGIRISCSGRVGGRSKKAQKAKTQSVQWGESGLHVFSSKLDFASQSASTLFGKVGIKVWLCFQ